MLFSDKAVIHSYTHKSAVTLSWNFSCESASHLNQDDVNKQVQWEGILYNYTGRVPSEESSQGGRDYSSHFVPNLVDNNTSDVELMCKCCLRCIFL